MSGIAKQSLGWILVAVLLSGTVACRYNGHRNMGATEKWVASDVHIVPKAFGLIFVPLFDAIFSPFTASIDYIGNDEQYHPDHKYLSYAGSRTIGRSDMGLGYQVWCSIFTIPIETVWLVLTGPIDLVNVLWFGDDAEDEEGDELAFSSYDR